MSLGDWTDFAASLCHRSATAPTAAPVRRRRQKAKHIAKAHIATPTRRRCFQVTSPPSAPTNKTSQRCVRSAKVCKLQSLPCWRRVANVQLQIRNDEDTGFNPPHRWGLIDFVARLQVWQLPDTSFRAVVTVRRGRWRTFRGALSPQNGTVQQGSGCGALRGYEIFEAARQARFALLFRGRVGVFDFGGTMADVLLPPHLQVGTTSLGALVSSFFTPAATVTDFSFDYFAACPSVKQLEPPPSAPRKTRKRSRNQLLLWHNALDGDFGEILIAASGCAVTPCVASAT